MRIEIVLIALVFAVLTSRHVLAVEPLPDELAEAQQWVANALLGSAAPPFSFTFDGQPSEALLPNWERTATSKDLDDERTARTITYTDRATGLQLCCEAIEYHDFPTVEWTLYFRNTGQQDTPIIERILPLDIHTQRDDAAEFVLHHFRGSDCRADDYAPCRSVLAPESSTTFASVGGRGTNGQMPYFNIESSPAKGLIAVLGWPGQWAATFARDAEEDLHIFGGQEDCHLKLLPGEEFRTPLVVLQFWNGEWLRAQNVWRSWMIAHNVPKPGGQLPPPQTLGGSSRAYEEMIKADTQSQIMFIDRYIEEGIHLDYWWMDAGWYVQERGWPHVGTWEVDTRRFPDGLRPISDHAHAKGIKILVWFEPERVTKDTWLFDNHPEWLLGDGDTRLLDLGNPEAREWLTEHVDGLLNTQGIDLYRQDFNMDPLPFWRANDADDRRGISENKHVVGYLDYWDELRRRHPNMLIDSCASGGRRNDLETMRRAVPLWRSDYAYEPIGHQCMTYGISHWLPYHGTGTVACVDAPYYGAGLTPVEDYAFWSNACPSTVCGVDMRVPEIDYPKLKKLFDAWRRVADLYWGDFYPLTDYHLEKDVWMAWQFHRPDLDKGMVQAFRRADSVYTTACLALHGLDPTATYRIEDVMTGNAATKTGAELMDDGLEITMPEQPMAKVLLYSKE